MIDNEKVNYSFLEKLIDSIEKWRGKNYFYCKAKCIAGPSGIKQLLMTSVFKFVPFTLFLLFNAKVKISITHIVVDIKYLNRSSNCIWNIICFSQYIYDNYNFF